MIFKLNFNRLFKEAWLRAITPQVLTSGFRKAGVYPLNSAQISTSSGTNSLSGTASSSGDGSDGGDSHSPSDNSGDSSSSNTNPASGDKSDVSSSSDANDNDFGDADRLDDSLNLGGSYLLDDSASRDNVLSPNIEAVYKRRYE